MQYIILNVYKWNNITNIGIRKQLNAIVIKNSIKNDIFQHSTIMLEKMYKYSS